MKSYIFFIFFLLFFSTLNNGLAENHQQIGYEYSSETLGGVPLKNLYAISQLKRRGISLGTYHVEGYIIEIYNCPPCVSGERCAPCRGDNVIISEKNVPRDDDILSSREAVIFVEDAEKFELGAKYKFLVQITDVRTVEKYFNNTKEIYSIKTD